jgi:hypothetical protein
MRSDGEGKLVEMHGLPVSHSNVAWGGHSALNRRTVNW